MEPRDRRLDLLLMEDDRKPGRLWHGGAPGRRVGDLLLPPSGTGLARTHRSMSLGYGLTQIGQRDDRVYLTSDKELARAYAGMWTRQGGGMGGGSLYKVATDDPLDPDADLLSPRYLVPGGLGSGRRGLQRVCPVRST
jgi:hypothetical protein